MVHRETECVDNSWLLVFSKTSIVLRGGEELSEFSFFVLFCFF